MSFLKSESVLTEPQLARIGSAALESTYTEDLIEELIFWLSTMKPKFAKHFMTGKMFEGKLEVLKSLGSERIKSKKKLQEFSEIITEIKEANNERISIIHGLWQPKNFLLAILDENKSKGHAMAGKQKKNAPPVDSNEISRIPERISAANSRLWHFAYDYWNWPPSRRRAILRSKLK